MIDTSRILKRKASGERTRSHALHLIGLLDSKLDAIARHEMYRRIAARRGMRGHEQVFEKMIQSDRTHLDWLKHQITVSILQS